VALKLGGKRIIPKKNKVSSKKREDIRQFLFSLSLFCLALYVRLELVSTARFSDDEAGFFSVGKAIIVDQKFPQLGPGLSGGKAHSPGPLLYYFVALGQVFYPNPEASNILIALLGAISVIFIFSALSWEFSRQACAFAAIFFAFSPWHIFYSDHISNTPLLMFVASLAFWLVMRLRKRTESWAVSLLVFLCALMPQLHLSCPFLWVGFYCLLNGRFRDWKISAVGLGLLMALICYFPYLEHEWQTQLGNFRAFTSAHGGGGRNGRFLYVPLYLFRFLTLDTTDFELAGYWGAYKQLDALKAAFLGSEVRPFSIFRLFNFVSSLTLAMAVIRLSFKERAKAKYKPFFRALGFSALFDMLLLAVLGKDFYSHYAVPPMIFLAPLIAIAVENVHRKYTPVIFVVLGIFVIGGVESVFVISKQFDARNGLAVERMVLNYLLATEQPVSLEFKFKSTLGPYKILAKEVYRKPLVIDAASEHKFVLGLVGTETPDGYEVIEQKAPVILFKKRN